MSGQAAFVKTLERGQDAQDQESVVAWFYRVLRNAILWTTNGTAPLTSAS